MDHSDDNSLFNFINKLTTIQFDKDEKDAKLFNNQTNGDSLGSNHSFSSEFGLLKKDFKSLSVCDQVDLGSTGNSDKSLSSFGSDSNDFTNENSAGHSEIILPSLTCLSDTNGPNAARESSQSPAFFGFSSSNSSSPPLSQISGPSSASSLSEAVSTVANGHHNSSCPTTTNNLTNTTSQNNNNHTSVSDFSFNSFANPPKSSVHSFGMKAESSFFNTNPLDSMFGSMLSSHPSGGTNGGSGVCHRSEPMSDSFSALLDNTSFASHHSPDLTSLEKRRFSSNFSQPSNLLPTSFSQDSLPHFFQNSSLPFSANHLCDSGDILSTAPQSASQSRKFSLFNSINSSVTPANNTSMTSCTTSLTSPIISTPLFSSSNFLFNNNESIDQRAHNLISSANLSTTTANNPNLQKRFESHLCSVASEINSTVQMYVNNLQMRKDQLLKQLEHVRSNYQVLAQSKGKSNAAIIYPRITFSRADSNMLKLVTSFGFLNSPAFAPYCQLTGEGLTMAVEGEPTCFSITNKNCFNEDVSTGGENVEVDIQAIETNAHHHNGSFLPVSSHIQKSVIDNANGKYAVTYMIPRGSNLRSVKIFITINGLSVSNSPILVNVKTERLREVWKRVALYGEEGSEVGKFCRPWGVAMVRLPIQRDSNHKPVGGDASQSIPLQSKPFYNWNCTAANKRDFLLTVADRSNNRIQLLKLSVNDSPSKSSPKDMFSSNYLLNNNNVDVSVLHMFGTGPGTRPGQFDRPAGIAINSNYGQIVVVDKDNHRIQVFDLTGNFQFKFGEKGSRAGQFCYPWDLAICPQTSLILVSDTRNRRIQLFTHFGQYLWHCGSPLDSPRGVAFLSPDRYIVSDFNKHRILIIDRNDSSMLNNQMANNRDVLLDSKYIGFGEGSAWGEFLRPQGLVAALNKNTVTGTTKFMQILCADSRNNRIAIWNSINQNFDYINDESLKGENSSAMGSMLSASFDRPSGIAMADNILAVVDFGNNRLQIFQRHTMRL